MELSESPTAHGNDTYTRSWTFRHLCFIPRGLPGLVEHLGWGQVDQGLMGPLVVVEPEVGAQFPAGLCGVGVGFQIHLLLLPVRH